LAFNFNKSKKHSFPKTDKEWVNFICSLHDEAIKERRPLEFQWATNIAYYKGFQHLRFNPVAQSLSRDLENEDYIINRISSFVETRLAKLTQSKPILGVLPDKPDMDTKMAAEISERLLKHNWKTQRKDEKLRTLLLLMLFCGSAFKKIIWNPESGEPIYSDQNEQGEVVFDENTGRQKMHKVFQGEIENHVKSAFSILASPGSRGIEDALWIMDRSLMTVQEIVEKYGEDNIDMEKLLESKPDLTHYEKFVQSLGSPAFSGFIGFLSNRMLSGDKIKDHEFCLVKEFWMKPNYVYPEGVLATVIGSQLVQFEDWPYECKEYPFVKYDEHEDPYSFYGQSTITRLIPIQRHYNRARTQIAKNADLMANVKWKVQKGHGMADDALTDEEGEVVEYNPNVTGPEQMGVAPLPNYVIENQNQDIVDFRDVGGEKEASQLPFPNITAGVALETASELANIPIIPVIRSLENSMVKEGRLELLLANEFYNDPRTLKIVGENNQVRIMKFKNEDLKYQTDVTIQMESGLGQSKAAQRQSLLDLFDRRAITDVKAFLKAYATGSIDILLKEDNYAENIAVQDIEDIKNGKMPQVLPTDNHIVHMQILTKFIQTPEFRRMPPDRQQLVMALLQQHSQFMGVQIAGMEQPQQEQVNPAAVGTPFGAQVTEGLGGGQMPPQMPQMGQ
jgi:hypothetical protein